MTKSGMFFFGVFMYCVIKMYWPTVVVWFSLW